MRPWTRSRNAGSDREDPPAHGRHPCSEGERQGGAGAVRGGRREPEEPAARLGQYPRRRGVPAEPSNIAEAIKRLAMFRDNGPFQNIPGLTRPRPAPAGPRLRAERRRGSRAGRHTSGGRQLPAIVPWVDEARYGMGWACSSRRIRPGGRRLHPGDAAAPPTEIGAKAQLQDRPVPAGAEEVRRRGDRAAGRAVHLRLPRAERRRPARGGPGLQPRPKQRNKRDDCSTASYAITPRTPCADAAKERLDNLEK